MEQEHIPDIYSVRKAISHKNQNYWFERLANQLPLFIAKATASVNPRRRHFSLDRPCFPANFRSQKPSEAQWESWCLDKWSIKHGIISPKPVKNAWHRLVARQVPLEPPVGTRRRLLTADLVGISEDGFPAIVELKGHTKQAAILALILQALDYGIRLRESWLYFFEEWREILAKYDWPTVQSDPHRIYLVCVAPSDVWEHEKLPRFAPDLTHYGQLKKALDSCGFPLSLVSLSTRTVNEVGFRIVAKPFDFAHTTISRNQNSESNQRQPHNRIPTQQIPSPTRKEELMRLNYLEVGGRYFHNNRLSIRTIERIEGDDVYWRSDSDSGICKRNTFLKKCCGYAPGSHPPPNSAPREYISKAVVTEMTGRVATLQQLNRTVEHILIGVSEIYSIEAQNQLRSNYEARSGLTDQINSLLKNSCLD